MKSTNVAAGIHRIFELQSRRTPVVRASSAAERCAKLIVLRDAIQRAFPEILQALAMDLGKPPFEATMDAGAALAEINEVVAQLEQWMKPVAVPPGKQAAPGATAQIVREPRGRVLIFGPWNFPFGLVFQPLVSAIAAGNTVVMKPSELTPMTSAVSAKIIEASFDESEVAVVQGGPDVATALLEQPFDHFFFTGSTQVGRRIMAAASRHLATVTLELGGKCPAIVDADVDVSTVCARIGWGKYLNAGQICLAPDHVWVPSQMRDIFAREFVDYVRRSYYRGDVLTTGDLARVINARHLERLQALLADAVSRGARILQGGGADGLRLEPTVLVDVPRGCALMQEEIFGPILPILNYDGVDDLIAEINSRGKPLALYVFSQRPEFVRQVLSRTSSGGVTVNDVLQHATDSALPFGGVGESGMGAYHGVHGFHELSHSRSVYYQAAVNPIESFLRPPYLDRLPG
jgi:aldehyde dehydrogenase (NAD+)